MFFLRFSKEVLVDEYTSRTEPGGGAPGNHPQGRRSGTRFDRVSQMEDPVNRPGRGQPCVITKRRLRPEIHDSAGSFRADVRGTHRYIRDFEVYDEILTTLSSTYALENIIPMNRLSPTAESRSCLLVGVVRKVMSEAV